MLLHGSLQFPIRFPGFKLFVADDEFYWSDFFTVQVLIFNSLVDALSRDLLDLGGCVDCDAVVHFDVALDCRPLRFHLLTPPECKPPVVVGQQICLKTEGG